MKISCILFASYAITFAWLKKKILEKNDPKLKAKFVLYQQRRAIRKMSNIPYSLGKMKRLNWRTLLLLNCTAASVASQFFFFQQSSPTANNFRHSNTEWFQIFNYPRFYTPRATDELVGDKTECLCKCEFLSLNFVADQRIRFFLEQSYPNSHLFCVLFCQWK